MNHELLVLRMRMRNRARRLRRARLRVVAVDAVVTQIPESARTLVRVRARHRCERCGSAAPNGHWHHRRSRRVVDEHRHCPCNGVWLCPTCHNDVHAHPNYARITGWIVSAWVEEPGTVPVRTPWGERTHDCEGGFTFTEGATHER